MCICMWTWALFLGNSIFSSFLSFGIFMKRILIKKNQCKAVCFYLFTKCFHMKNSSNLTQKNWFLILGVLWKRFISWLRSYSKLASANFLFFHQMIVLQKPWKILISSKKLFLFSRYSDFVFPSSPFFLPAGYCFRGWSKINLKVGDTINCLNNNSINTFCLTCWEGKLVWHWNFVHR